MNQDRKTLIVLHIVETVYSALLIAWFILPFVDKTLGNFDPRLLPLTLYGYPPDNFPAYIVSLILVIAIPVISVWKIAAFFLDRRIPFLANPNRLLPVVFNIVSSGSVIAIMILHMVAFASSARYFQAFSPVSYAVFLVSLGYNAYYIFLLVLGLSRRDVSYQEYLEFRRTSEQERTGAVSVIPRQGIQRRLLISFLPLILVIIVAMSIVLLRDFSNTILATVIASGETLAERTASVVKSNPADRIAIDDYLGIEARKNEEKKEKEDAASSFRFNFLSVYLRDSKTGNFEITGSTDRKLIGTRIQKPGFQLAETTHLYNTEAATFEFLSPIVLSGKFLGYVMVDYARDVIYEPYFRTQVKVFVIAALFIYAAVFLIYVFGRAIVFPILFLRMSVNAISTVLAGMIKGKTRISSELLQYKDRVNTRDEIKLLSNEMKNMTTVIRGVIPYISASTLKHAEREAPMTESKELTFLFTDIRGFTTLCEGMSPDKVVEMLNHYLDLQSSVILANDGDVDKFVGDEIMAMFDGARRELNACKASMEIRRAMSEEQKLAELAARNVISIGIGINTGLVVFGSVGAKDRMDFTSIGDTVNLAARLEGANKTYGTKTLITEAVHDKVKEEYICREVDLLTVKGKTQPVRIFELMQEKAHDSQKLEHLKKVFESALAQYRKQKWEAAEKGFTAARDEHNDETSDVFLKRIALFRKNPLPKDWDGVFNLTVK